MEDPKDPKMSGRVATYALLAMFAFMTLMVVLAS